MKSQFSCLDWVEKTEWSIEIEIIKERIRNFRLKFQTLHHSAYLMLHNDNYGIITFWLISTVCQEAKETHLFVEWQEKELQLETFEYPQPLFESKEKKQLIFACKWRAAQRLVFADYTFKTRRQRGGFSEEVTHARTFMRSVSLIWLETGQRWQKTSKNSVAISK